MKVYEQSRVTFFFYQKDIKIKKKKKKERKVCKPLNFCLK